MRYPQQSRARLRTPVPVLAGRCHIDTYQLALVREMKKALSTIEDALSGSSRGGPKPLADGLKELDPGTGR